MDDDTDGNVDYNQHEPDGQRKRPHYEEQTVVADICCRVYPVASDSVGVQIGSSWISQHNTDAGCFYWHAEVDYVTQRGRHGQDESQRRILTMQPVTLLVCYTHANNSVRIII